MGNKITVQYDTTILSKYNIKQIYKVNGIDVVYDFSTDTVRRTTLDNIAPMEIVKAIIKTTPEYADGYKYYRRISL